MLTRPAPRYARSHSADAIKSLGRSVIDRIIEERNNNGKYRTLSDFIERTAEGEINKRAIENLIKAGACDSLDGNRRQMTLVHTSIVDNVMKDKKTSLAGQISLFDIVSEEEKKHFTVSYPNVEEFDKETLLGFEKEVLGIYLSGHPLEGYMDKIKKNVTALAVDFLREEESGIVKVADNAHVIVGGMISEKSIKFTRNNKAMAFIKLEDLTGAVEIIIFPREYEKFQHYLNEDSKIFVVGKATVEDEQNGKIICERIVPFEETTKELWLQFNDKDEYMAMESDLMNLLRDSDGNDEVVIYVKNPKAIKRLSKNQTINVTNELLSVLFTKLGEKNVKVVEKNIENIR